METKSIDLLKDQVTQINNSTIQCWNIKIEGQSAEFNFSYEFEPYDCKIVVADDSAKIIFKGYNLNCQSLQMTSKLENIASSFKVLVGQIDKFLD